MAGVSALQTMCRKTKMCKFFAHGLCDRGRSCAFAHSLKELQAVPDLSYTKRCRIMLHTGSCNDSQCTFAHHADELRKVGLMSMASNPGGKPKNERTKRGRTRHSARSGAAHGNAPQKEQRAAAPCDVHQEHQVFIVRVKNTFITVDYLQDVQLPPRSQSQPKLAGRSWEEVLESSSESGKAASEPPAQRAQSPPLARARATPTLTLVPKVCIKNTFLTVEGTADSRPPRRAASAPGVLGADSGEEFHGLTRRSSQSAVQFGPLAHSPSPLQGSPRCPFPADAGGRAGSPSALPQEQEAVGALQAKQVRGQQKPADDASEGAIRFVFMPLDHTIPLSWSASPDPGVLQARTVVPVCAFQDVTRLPEVPLILEEDVVVWKQVRKA